MTFTYGRTPILLSTPVSRDDRAQKSASLDIRKEYTIADNEPQVQGRTETCFVCENAM